MWAAAIMKVACPYYLHVLGLVALIPSHNLQPLAQDNLIEMEILQSSDRVQLDPICLVPSPVAVEVCIDLRCHGEAYCDLAGRSATTAGNNRRLR